MPTHLTSFFFLDECVTFFPRSVSEEILVQFGAWVCKIQRDKEGFKAQNENYNHCISVKIIQLIQGCEHLQFPYPARNIKIKSYTFALYLLCCHNYCSAYFQAWRYIKLRSRWFQQYFCFSEMERTDYSFSLIPSESKVLSAPKQELTFRCNKTKNTAVWFLQVYLSFPLALKFSRPSLTWDDSISVQEQGDSQQHEDAQGQDVRPPPAPRRAAVVAGRADDGLQQEAQDGADQPHQAVQAAGKANAQKHRRDECGFHGVAEFPSKHDHAVEDKSASWAPWGLHGSKHCTLHTVHVVLFGASVACWVLVQRSADVFAGLRDPAGLGPHRLVLW